MCIIDLTRELYEGMPQCPGAYHARVEVEITGRYETEKCVVRRLVLATHSGTHIDAPAHFVPEGLTIDKVPLSRLVCETAVVDLRDKQAKSVIQPADLLGRLDNLRGKGVLLRTGWYKRWQTGDFYQDFPYLTDEAAKALVQAAVSFVAVDIPLSAAAHSILLGNGILLIENLINLDAITQPSVTFIALPLKLRDGDGAPARVIAIENDAGKGATW